jgi:hypothetical protein
LPDIDISRLLGSDEPSSTKNTIWRVHYTAKLPTDLLAGEDLKCPDCGEEHDVDEIRTVTDQFNILAGEDGQEAIDRVREIVLSEENQPRLTDFQVQGLLRLASAEVV